ncbi:hypothetical protein B0H66DRAFT_308498 [Apodospora peruviana]|uniref:Uncharacterized protein n=1 Tax=Apodospora peruviana TaxID=516989 RepID=A0AAE0M2P9_9PEZI|nr:hypothetical protein B0H66DRAFT_308498 [Apodospora peruviana]
MLPRWYRGGILPPTRRPRFLLAVALILVPFLLGLHIRHHRDNQPTPPPWAPFAPATDDDGILFHLPPPPPTTPLPSTNLTVNLVIASVAADNTSWTEQLRPYLPNLKIIRYVSDADNSYNGTGLLLRPPVPRKGREALIYHTYFHDFYDTLPDVSVLIHSHENPWHIEPALLRSMTFALSRLNLNRIATDETKSYFNLRVSWKEACPAWINTTLPASLSTKKEESFVGPALRANFGVQRKDWPEVFGGTCCSQFAVSRAAIQRNPKTQYKKHMDWLVNVGWSDYITGRVWEHLWPWLFRGEAVSCPPERETYCDMYGVCFGDDETPRRVNELAAERRVLEEQVELGHEIFDPQAGVYARKRIPEIDGTIRMEVAEAVKRGEEEGKGRKGLDFGF